MVKWYGYCASQSTWEPKDHLPADLVEAFENPDPDPVRVEEARERIGLVFERETTQGLLSESEQLRHINELEVLSVHFALWFLSQILREQ